MTYSHLQLQLLNSSSVATVVNLLLLLGFILYSHVRRLGQLKLLELVQIFGVEMCGQAGCNVPCFSKPFCQRLLSHTSVLAF